MRKFNEMLEARAAKATHQIDKRAAEIKKVTDKFPGVRWIISLGLESNYTKKAALAMRDLLKGHFDEELAYNPIPRLSGVDVFTGMLGGTYYELHQYSARAKKRHRNNCIQNGDGTSFVGKPRTSDRVREVREWARQCRKDACICLFWDARWQGIHSQKFIYPDRRNFKFDSKDVNLIKEELANVY